MPKQMIYCPQDIEMAAKLTAALPGWTVLTFVTPKDQHGVSLFVPNGIFHRVRLTIGEAIELANHDCTEKEFEQVLVAVVANTNLAVEIVLPAKV